MSDLAALDEANAALQKQATSGAAAVKGYAQAVTDAIHDLDDRLAAVEAAPPVPVPPDPPKPPTVGVLAPAYLVTLYPNQRDPNSGVNKYTHGWVKSLRVDPSKRPGWTLEGLLQLDDYPDEFCLLEGKQFLAPFPGRTSNFHLVGGDTVHNGVSPLSLDWHQGRMTGQPADIPASSLVICSQAEKDGSTNRMHWLVLTQQELTGDPFALWAFLWRIRWRRDRTGYVHLTVYRNGDRFRQVDVDNIRTVYADQKPELFVWLGGYESEGLPVTARIRQTLDYRGTTPELALSDRPAFGSVSHSESTTGGPPSSVVPDGTLGFPA